MICTVSSNILKAALIGGSRRFGITQQGARQGGMMGTFKGFAELSSLRKIDEEACKEIEKKIKKLNHLLDCEKKELKTLHQLVTNIQRTGPVNVAWNGNIEREL